MDRPDRPPSSPQIARRKRTMKRLPVFLPQEIWDQLTAAAKFHTAVFEAEGKSETVSRNDFIMDSLIWALAAYWKDKGGRPEDESEYAERAKKFVEKQRREAKTQ